jgi:hypothetical protein
LRNAECVLIIAWKHNQKQGNDRMSVNPFFFGKAVSGTAFIDRTKEIEAIGSSLERGQSVILFSPRRFGTTSLIKNIIMNLEKKGILVFYLDLYRVTTMEHFGSYYSQTVLSSLRSSADKLFSLARALIPSLKPKLTYVETNMPSIELEISLETMRRQSTLVEMFNFLEKYCAKKRLRACMIFDEFQEITAFDSDRLLEREMRAAFQQHELTSYAFLGSKTHLMHELFKDKNRPFYNFGAHFELDAIPEAEWFPFVKNQFKKAGTPTLTDDDCKRIIALTHGHPYYTQMLCSEIWELLTHSGKNHQDPVTEGLYSILSKENHAFVEIWDTFTSTERKLCKVLSETGPVAAFSSDFITTYRFGAASSLQRVIQRLTRRGIINRSINGFSISDPIFTHWLKREDETLS